MLLFHQVEKSWGEERQCLVFSNKWGCIFKGLWNRLVAVRPDSSQHWSFGMNETYHEVIQLIGFIGERHNHKIKQKVLLIHSTLVLLCSYLFTLSCTWVYNYFHPLINIEKGKYPAGKPTMWNWHWHSLLTH